MYVPFTVPPLNYLTFINSLFDLDHFIGYTWMLFLPDQPGNMEPKGLNAILFQQESDQWKADVLFCRDEIKVLNRYLQEVMDKNADSAIKNDITQFRQELSDKIEISYKLMDAIRVQDEMIRSATSGDEFIEASQLLLKETVAEFCKSYNALKSLFVRFLAKADLIM